jgi:hypothetical protein
LRVADTSACNGKREEQEGPKQNTSQPQDIPTGVE